MGECTKAAAIDYRVQEDEMSLVGAVEENNIEGYYIKVHREKLVSIYDNSGCIHGVFLL